MVSKGAQPASATLDYVEVLYTEEKGSDVNLATHLLYDAFADDYEMAVIISNDSDLALPIQMVKVRLGKKIGIVNPQINRNEYRDSAGKIDYSKVRYSSQLVQYANFYKCVTEEALARSQFPDKLQDQHGTFQKPSSW